MGRFSNNFRNHSNWLGYYRKKYFGGRDGFIFRLRSGMSIHVSDRMMHTYKECFFDETYTKGLPRHIIKRMHEADPLTVVDVGANVGYFSLFILSNFQPSRVYAYEPMPNNFKLLDVYAQENPERALYRNNMAVGKDTQPLQLAYDASEEFTTAATVLDREDQPDKIEVPCTTLSAVMYDNELAKIDFLKLDCEGSEYGIIYGSDPDLLQRIHVIAIETHRGKGQNENRDDLAKYLEDQGFTTNKASDIIWGWR